ncbi:MAG: PH domain-containing protein, partial [Syntrophorhabdales bacterium]
MRTRLQPGETVALIVKKHWIVLAKPTLFFLAVLFSFPLRHARLAGFEAMVSYLFPYLLALSAGLLLYRYLDRRVNIWVVTNSRLIDEFGLVTHRSKENPLDKINDIVVEQTLAGRIFNYGSISVQTAAKAGETVIEFVERPEELKQTINAQKAMRAEREKRPNLAGREVPLRQGTPLPQTVLLHESLKPPFSLRCPHCAGEIIIDYAGGTVTSTIATPSEA